MSWKNKPGLVIQNIFTVLPHTSRATDYLIFSQAEDRQQATWNKNKGHYVHVNMKPEHKSMLKPQVLGVCIGFVI